MPVRWPSSRLMMQGTKTQSILSRPLLIEWPFCPARWRESDSRCTYAWQAVSRPTGRLPVSIPYLRVSPALFRLCVALPEPAPA
jgi:hypothetical protein